MIEYGSERITKNNYFFLFFFFTGRMFSKQIFIAAYRRININTRTAMITQADH